MHLWRAMQPPGSWALARTPAAKAAAVASLFELVFGLWLAIRSVSVPLPESPSDREALPTGRVGHTAAHGSVRPDVIG
jgi:hypothetical protein